jgi:uncharacterized protein (TIGR03437 family)
LTVTPALLPGGAVGSPYTATLGAAGGAPPYNWTVSSGSLPPGLSLGAATGVVNGTPNFAAGSPFQFNIAVSDAAGNRSAPQSFSIAISGSGTTPAPQRIVTTIAGTDFVFNGDGKPALEAQIDPLDVAVDKNGNYYIADPGNNRILQISPAGILTTVAGNGIGGFSGDGGPAVNASLNVPYGLALDSAGNIYVADTNNLRIRKITTDGIISTIAGSGGSGSTGDGGQAILGTFYQPLSVAVDNLNNVYVGDCDPSEQDSRVRKITPAGIISTLAGNGALKFPTGVAADSSGNVYIADLYDCRVRKVSASGVISTVAGDRACGNASDGGLAIRSPLEPFGVAVDSLNNLYISSVNTVCEVTTDGIMHVLAGSSDVGYSGDGGSARSALLSTPVGLAVDTAGNVYFADTGNVVIRLITKAGIIRTTAGNGQFRFSGDGGPSSSATLYFPSAVAPDAAGNVYIADEGNDRVRKVAPGNPPIITTLAGNGTAGGQGDGGQASAASLYLVYASLAVDTLNNLFIGDVDNGEIREVTPQGIITSPVKGVSARGVTVDPSGNLYFSDDQSSTVQRVTPSGVKTTYAGNQSQKYCGDNGTAAAACLNSPWGLALDAIGNLYIADSGNSRVRKVSPSGAITTFAGNGSNGPPVDGGLATDASIAQPATVAADAAGNVYVPYGSYDMIYAISPSGAISRLAGTAFATGFSGDGGPAIDATFNNIQGLAADIAGNVFIADTGNHRVREVLAAQPAIQVSTSSLTFSGQSTGAPTQSQSFNLSSSVPGGSSVPGLGFSIVVNTTSGGNWLAVTPQAGVAPRLIDVTADPSQLPATGTNTTYTGTITILAPNATPPITTINVTFSVSAAQPPTLAPLDPLNFSFSFVKSTPAQSQRLTISNAGGGTLNFTAAATIATPAGATPLPLSQTSGQASPGSPAIVTVTADPVALGLGPGTFSGTVSVTAGASTLSVPVTIGVSALDQAILLSQRGLFFTGVSQGGVVPPQTFAVRNIGTQAVAWTAKALPIPATPVWLKVSPTAGSTDAVQSPPTVTVSVDPSQLGEGTYYGLVEVDAPTAANSPQVLTVVLQVLKAGADTGAALAPGSLLFATTAGGPSPGSQNLLVYNITAKAKTFRSVVSADPGLSIVTLPTDATLDPQNPSPIVVQPFTTSLVPGVYTGIVTLQFDDGRVRRVTVKVIVSKTGGTSSTATPGSNVRAGDRADAPVCTPTRLQPILTAPDDAFDGATGFGIKLGVFVKDDCGVPLQSGSVKVSFSNSDTTSTLQPLQGGLWEGTWYTHNPSASVNLMVHAVDAHGISGDLQTNGSLASETPPAFDEVGVFSVFGGAQFVSLAPGEVISIYGSGLAETSLAGSGFPLQTTLVDTQVFIGLRPLPLYYVSDTQVDALVPYSLTDNSLNASQQILVQRGNTLSQPVSFNVATAEPTILDRPGGVTDYPNYPDGPYYTVSAGTPAHAGDTIVLNCLGLGAVAPPVADGGLPTSAGSQAVAPVQVLIGNQPATVTQALSPQFPGLYLVAAVIPAGVPTGSSVAVTISAGGQTSPPILIPIQ